MFDNIQLNLHTKANISWQPKLQFTGDVRGFLRSVPLFRELETPDLHRVAEAMELKRFPANACLFRQGDVGDSFYVVTQGEAFVKVLSSNFLQCGEEVRLTKDSKIVKTVYPAGTLCIVDKFDCTRGYPFTVRELKSGDRGRLLPEEIEPADAKRPQRIIASCRPGDYFGEHALIKGGYRNATIIAGPNGPLTVAYLAKSTFEELDLAHKLQFAKRRAVWAAQEIAFEERYEASKETTKTPAQKQLIARAIDSNKILHEMVTLNGDDREAMVNAAFKRVVRAGDVVVYEGNLFNNEFFIVESGAFQFSISSKYGGEYEKINQFSQMQSAKPGQSFGELALIHNAPTHCTVQATQDSVVWVIDRMDFRGIMHSTFTARMAEYLKVINSIEVFTPLLQDERVALCENLVEKHFLLGEHLLTAGKENDTFFILLSGSVEKEGSGKIQSTPGTYFGEYGILQRQPARETIMAASDDVYVACISQHDFERFLGSLEDIMVAHAQHGGRVIGASKVQVQAHEDAHNPENHGKNDPFKGSRPPRLKELKKIGLLGCGGFGAVTLEQGPDGTCYALKALSKGYILKTGMQKLVMNEKNIQMLCTSFFIIKCYATYNSSQSLYFLLEPAMGGELYATYHRYRFHGKVAHARFYCASVIFAFNHLHERNVIFRDLKPENLLLDINGRCKLTDMGLAKQTIVKTYTVCGTPDYFAPEVIQHAGQNPGIDWWCWGVLLHELMSGHTPFEASSPEGIYQKVVKGVSVVEFPYEKKDPNAADLVRKCLQKNPNDRLAMRPGKSKNLQIHPWYSGYDFNGHEKNTNQVPYHPEVKSLTDISNFRAKEADLPPQIPYKDPKDGWDAKFATL